MASSSSRPTMVQSARTPAGERKSPPSHRYSSLGPTNEPSTNTLQPPGQAGQLPSPQRPSTYSPPMYSLIGSPPPSGTPPMNVSPSPTMVGPSPTIVSPSPTMDSPSPIIVSPSPTTVSLPPSEMTAPSSTSVPPTGPSA